MIPLREGWLPYPGVEIREVRSAASETAAAAAGLAAASSTTPTNAAATAAVTGKRKSSANKPANTPATATAPDPAVVLPMPIAIETDYRNLGETVRVVADRGRVTLSLDAGGPGGGPLLLDVQPRWGVAGAAGGGGSDGPAAALEAGRAVA